MVGSVNKVILVGNLGRDPEVRSMQNGGKVCNLSVATSERWKDRNSGEQQNAPNGIGWWSSMIVLSMYASGSFPNAKCTWKENCRPAMDRSLGSIFDRGRSSSIPRPACFA